MPRTRKDTVQITMRVPRSWLGDADEVAAILSTEAAAITVTRTDAFRVAIARGIRAIREEKTCRPRSTRR